jgi:hypothetical protein
MLNGAIEFWVVAVLSHVHVPTLNCAQLRRTVRHHAIAIVDDKMSFCLDHSQQIGWLHVECEVWKPKSHFAVWRDCDSMEKRVDR